MTRISREFKSLLIIAVMFVVCAVLGGCGVGKEICGSDIEMGCNAAFGYDYKDKIDSNTTINNEQNDRIKELEQSLLDKYRELVRINEAQDYSIDSNSDGIDRNSDAIDSNSSDIDSTGVTVAGLAVELDSVQQLILNIQNSIGELDSEMDYKDAELMDALQVLEFELNEKLSIDDVEMVDLCGNGGEILIRVGEKYVAYFQQGNKRYLVELSNGNYRTTDGENCRFSISGGGVVYP